MARGKRTRLATGIWQDAYGRTITVKVARVQHERRFPLDSPIESLVSKRRIFIDELTQKAVARDSRGSLGDDVRRFLATQPKGTARSNYERDCAAWTVLPLEGRTWAERSRHGITAPEIREQLARWLDAGAAASTVNHRRQALRKLWDVLDGKQAPNPVRDVPRVPPRPDEARAVSPAIIEAIFEAMPDRGRPEKGHPRPTVNLAKLRLRVLATTGLPPAQVMRLVPGDVDLQARTIYVRPRRKGRGVAGRTLPLTHAAVVALRAFGKANAWGTFSTHSMGASFSRAVKTARTAWQAAGKRWDVPQGFRAYDMRHSFLSAAYAATGDIRAVAELGLHSSLQTTRRYTEAAVSDRTRTVRDALDRASRVPAARGKKSKNVRQRPSAVRRPTVAATREPRAKRRKIVRK